MTDLLEHLKSERQRQYFPNDWQEQLMSEAAAEIERLRASLLAAAEYNNVLEDERDEARRLLDDYATRGRPGGGSAMIDYYGIVTPGGQIWWIAEDRSRAWMAFFSNAPAAHHRLPIGEAVCAYEAIGYRCVKLRVEEVDDEPIT